MDGSIRKVKVLKFRRNCAEAHILILFLVSNILFTGLASADLSVTGKGDLESSITLPEGANANEQQVSAKRNNLRPIKKETVTGDAHALYQQERGMISNSIAQRLKSRIQSMRSPTAQSQAKNLRKMFDNTKISGNFDAHINKDNGTPKFIRGRGLSPVLQINKSNLTKSKTVAREFLSSNAALFKLNNPTQELGIRRQNIDTQGRKHFHFQQKYQSIPIWGKQMSVHLDDYDSVYFVNGVQIPTPKNFDTNPEISEDEAIEITKQHLNISGEIIHNPLLSITGQETPVAELVIYPPANGPLRLAYKVEIMPKFDERWIYFVDAKTGEYVHRIFNIQNAPVTASGNSLAGTNRSFGAWHEESEGYYYLIDPTIPTADEHYDPVNRDKASGDTKIFDADHRDGTIKYYIRSRSQNSGWDPAGVSVAYNTRKAYDYYRDTHNRDSIDGKGMNLMGVIHLHSQLNNAYWNGAYMSYGDGDNQIFSSFAGGLDITAHEMTHGVIEYTANLIYENQSGALNESFADVFAVMVDRDDWLVGEDVTVASPGHLRDMANPANGLTAQPAHMDEYRNLPNTPETDRGGVHINSGIPNRACYLIAEGLTTEGLGTSIGREKTEKIYYLALTTYLLASSDFLDAREAIRQAAEDLYDAGSAEETAVQIAFGEVGIGSADLCSSTGEGNETDVDPVSGEDIMVYLFPNDGIHDPSIDKCYGLWAYTNVPESSYNEQYDTLLSTGATSQTVTCDSTAEEVFPAYTRPSVYTNENGTVIFYVGTDNNIYAVNADGSGHTQITDTGIVKTIALSPDGSYFAFTSTGKTDNHIYIADLVGENHLTVELVPADYQNGGSGATNTIYNADALAFDYSGNKLVFDALNCVSTPSSSCDNENEGYRFWSIGFVEIDTGGQVSYPFPNQNPNYDVGFPSFARNNSYILAMDILDRSNWDSDGTIAEGVYTFNRETQDLMGVASPADGTSLEGVFGAPTFWGDDDFVNMQVFQASSTHPFRVPIDDTWEGDAANAEKVFPGDIALPVIHRVGLQDLTASLELSATSLDFGSAETGTTVTQSLILTNSGNRDIDISNMAITGSSAFSQNCSNAIFNKGATMTIRIRFSPESTGTEDATFTIDSDADTPSVDIALTGIGEPQSTDGDGDGDGSGGGGSGGGGGGGGGGCFVAAAADGV